MKVLVDKNFGLLGNKMKASITDKVKGKKDIDENDPENK